MPTADHAVCLSLPSSSKTGPRGYTNDPHFYKVTASTAVDWWKYEMKQIKLDLSAFLLLFELGVQWVSEKTESQFIIKSAFPSSVRVAD